MSPHIKILYGLSIFLKNAWDSKNIKNPTPKYINDGIIYIRNLSSPGIEKLSQISLNTIKNKAKESKNNLKVFISEMLVFIGL